MRETRSLTDGIRRRDPDVLEAVAKENILPLVRAARAWGLEREDAYDAVQETLLVFVQKAESFDGRARVRTWLFGILLRKVAERRRASYREEAVDDIEGVVEARFDARGRWLRPPKPTDAGVTAAEVMVRLNECLDELPDRSRGAFVLREVEQMETFEACKILEVSTNYFGVLLHRARNRLRECLESKGIHGSGDAAV